MKVFTRIYIFSSVEREETRPTYLLVRVEWRPPSRARPQRRSHDRGITWRGLFHHSCSPGRAGRRNLPSPEQIDRSRCLDSRESRGCRASCNNFVKAFEVEFKIKGFENRIVDVFETFAADYPVPDCPRRSPRAAA